MDLSPLHFRALRATLAQLPNTGSAGSSAAIEQAHELKRQLDKSRPAFKSLLEKLPPNQKEKEELEKGRLLPFGATGIKAVNQEFRLEALFLASQLAISERLAGTVLLAVLNDHRPRPGRPTAENAVILYYEERRDLLLSLELLLSYASNISLQASMNEHVSTVINSFVHDLVTSEDPKEGSWAKRVLKEMDNQQKAVDDIKSGVLPTAQGVNGSGAQARFNDDINNLRVQAHQEERRLLATALYHAAAAHLLSKSDILAIARWTGAIKDTKSDYALPVCVMTLLAIMDGSSLATLELLANEAKFISDLQSFITTKVNWKPSQASEVSPVQPLIQLAWCLFLINAFRHRPTLLNETKISENIIEDNIVDAIHNGALDFASNSLLRFKKPIDPFEELGWSSGTRNELAMQQQCPDVDITFEAIVVEEVDNLIESFIVNASSILRKVRHREEDVLLATSLGRTTGTPTRRRALSNSRRGSEGPNQSTASSNEQRRDVETLFGLIATLYRDSPDAALKYWVEEEEGDRDAQHRHSRLSSFLRWAADCRVHTMQQAFFEMLGSLAYGPRSATYAFEFLAQNAGTDGPSNSLCSWTSLFEALTFYSSARSQNEANEIPPDEVTLLKSFLRVLRIVAEQSPLARASLYDNQRYKPVATLFALIVQPIPIDLKAALLDAVAAFTKITLSEEGPGMAALSTEIAKRTWVTLENSQILPTIPQRDARGALVRNTIFGNQGGIALELEQVESPSKVYPATTSFISLLVSLLGSSSGHEEASSPTSASASMEVSLASRTIPDNLGAPHRDPSFGIDAYTRFVVDDVLLQVDSREHKSVEEKWRITERCLAYLEACLTTLSFGGLLEGMTAEGAGLSANAIHRIAAHPGFDVLVRLLTGSRLLEKILRICSAELEDIDDERTSSTSLQCLLRALRIIIRVFSVQSAFMEVIVPTLLEARGGVPAEKLSNLRSIQPLDQHLLYSSPVVVKIAVLVNCFHSKAIALASIRILSYLADSTTFSVTDMFRDVYRTKMNRLAGLIDASDETDRVTNGFVLRLSRPYEFGDIASEVEHPDVQSNLDEQMQVAILDLLLRNTQPTSAAPNIAHLLLGLDIRQRSEDLDIKDSADDTPQSCLHTILAFLDKIQSDATCGSEDTDLPNILVVSPVLAEKCYRLLRQLCLHEYTSVAVTQYLRRKEFFLRQAQALPFHIPESETNGPGHVTLGDGSRICTSASALVSTLDSQAWLLDCLALELNNLIMANELERAVRLLSIIYGSQGALASAERNQSVDNPEGLTQSLPRMLEIFYSLDVSWTDGIVVNETPISIFAALRFETCLRTQPSGCEIYDFQSVLSLLQSAKRTLQQQGALNSQQQQLAVKAESFAILQNLVVENNRREIQHARYHSLKAWRSLLDVTLTQAFDILPSNGTDSLLLDLLGSVLPPLSAEDADPAVQETFAGAAVLLMSQLRRQGLAQTEGTAASSQIFSAERLIPILQSILQAIIQPGLPPAIRGNLYAVLLQYFQHSAVSQRQSRADGDLDTIQGDYRASEENADDTLSLYSNATTHMGRRTSTESLLQKSILSVVQPLLDRLLAVVSLDASAGDEVWQTVSFTTLDSIAAVVGRGARGSKLSSTLAKLGYLQDFVSSLKDTEASLSDTLTPDPESLNAIYAYEAKMCFFIRMAATKEGAERLLDLKLIPMLADCTYLGAKPRATDANLDFDAFLPPVVQRYHQLLMPALQVALAIVRSSGARNATAARQVLNLLTEQQDAFRAILDEAAAAPSMSCLQESHLIVELIRSVLPVLSNENTASPTGLGPLHTSLMGMAGALLAEQDYISAVQPMSDDELRDAHQSLAGHRSSLFEDKLTSLLGSLQLSLLEYFKFTSKRHSSAKFQPVWLPIFQLDDPVKGNIRGSLPTMRGAFNYILDQADLLQELLQDRTVLEHKLVNFDDMSSSELEMYEESDEQGLDPHERRQRVHVTMLQLRRHLQSGILLRIYLLEASLLLLWRHLCFYLNDSENTSLGSSAKSKLEFGNVRPGQSLRNNVDVRGLRQNASGAFALIMERLDSLHLPSDGMSVDTRPHEALVASLLRSSLDLLSDQALP